MRKKLLTIISTAAITLLMVILLYARSEHYLKAKNNFLRHLPAHFLSDLKKLNLGANSYYFAGADKDSIYLGNSTVPLMMTSISYNLDSAVQRMISMKGDSMMIAEYLQLRRSDSGIYLINTHTSELYIAKNAGTANNQLSYNGKFNISFIEQVDITKENNFLLKYYDPIRKNTFIGKTLPAEPLIEFSLPKQVDGHFCEDGQFIRSLETRKKGYFYYYRNKFLVFDSINIQSREIKTIDPVAQAEIRLKDYRRSDGKIARTMAHPPLIINRVAAMDDQFVYIQSDRKADNENHDTFSNSSVVDIYEIETGNYKFSFYLPKFDEHKISGMAVIRKRIYALSGNIIFSYGMSL